MMPARPVNEAERMLALTEYDILDTLPEEAYDDATRLANYVCGTPTSLVTLIDADRLWIKSRVGFGQLETPRNISFCAHAILNPNAVFVVEDTTKDERFVDNPLVNADHPIRFYAGSPLVTPQGEGLGTLCVIDYKPHRLSQEQLDALASISRSVMRTLEMRRTVHALAVSIASVEQASRESETRQAIRPLVRQIVHGLLQHGGLAPPMLTYMGQKIPPHATTSELPLLLAAYENLGLGSLSMVENRADRSTFVGHDLLEVRRGAGTTTCYLALGYLQGALARDRHAPAAQGTEIACESRGDPACRFVVQIKQDEARKRLDSRESVTPHPPRRPPEL